MSHFIINGGSPLAGEIHVQGSKNAALPLMAAAVLNKGITRLSNIPDILDVHSMIQILQAIGCEVRFASGELYIDATTVDAGHIPTEWTGKMRSGVMLLAPLLVRCGQVNMGLPGGCSIGKRPVDLHLKALRAFGAEVNEQKEQMQLHCEKLKGTTITLAYPSVGATENILMAAMGAEGNTILKNAAKEPEIAQLCDMLRLLDAKIEEQEDGSLFISGGYHSKEIQYRNESDRIVAVTWLCVVAASGGQLQLLDVNPIQFEAVLQVLEQMDCQIRRSENGVWVAKNHRLQNIARIETGPYPGFPTDSQSLLMAVCSLSKGTCCICENVFEDRFQTAKELQKMGARIQIKGNCAWVHGMERLYGKSVIAPDLRGGAALIVAALGAEGCCRIEQADYVLRGYEHFPEQLRKVGARIQLE